MSVKLGELVVGAVAERSLAAMLAAAPGDLLGRLDVDDHRPHAGIEARVRAVAIRLVGRMAAGAPRLGARSLVLHVRRLLGAYRFGHSNLNLVPGVHILS